jgi:hypothetical protein
MKLSGAHLTWRYLVEKTGHLEAMVATSLLGVRLSELLGRFNWEYLRGLWSRFGLSPG